MTPPPTLEPIITGGVKTLEEELGGEEGVVEEEEEEEEVGRELTNEENVAIAEGDHWEDPEDEAKKVVTDVEELLAVAEAVEVAEAVAVAEADAEVVAEEVAVAVSDKGIHPGTFQEIQGQYPEVAEVEQKDPGSQTISLRYKVLPGPEVAGHWETSIVVL